MANEVKRFHIGTQGPMMTPSEQREQAAWLRKQPGEKAQRAAELFEMAANAQEKRDQEFTPEEVAEITGSEK